MTSIFVVPLEGSLVVVASESIESFEQVVMS